MIPVLDMLEAVLSAEVLQEEEVLSEMGKKIMQKCERRLQELPGFWQISEIDLQDGQIRTGEVRVIETVRGEDVPPNTILRVCRKGYIRRGRVLRPADVISSINAG